MVDYTFMLIHSFITLFVILDPFLSMAMFIGLTKNSSAQERAKHASTAVGIAAILLFIFLLIGPFILDIIGIGMDSFMIAGGIIILLLGIKTVLGLGFTQQNVDSAIILIGTPMLSGPGTLTTIIVLSNMYGIGVAVVAGILVLLATWLILIYSNIIHKIMGNRVIEIFSRIIGLIMTAFAVQFIITGIKTTIAG